jgi:hypothetical protein
VEFDFMFLTAPLDDLTLTLTLTGTKTHPQRLIFVHPRLPEGNIGKQDVIVSLGSVFVLV